MTLSPAQGLALARIGIGLYFIDRAFDKLSGNWLATGAPMARFLESQFKSMDLIYRPFVEGVVLPNAALFAQLVTVGELVAGISLTLGLFTRVGALTGIWLALNYWLARGTLNPNGGIDRLAVVLCLASLLASAGLVWGLDGRLRRTLAAHPLSRWTAGIPAEPPAEPATWRREHVAA